MLRRSSRAIQRLLASVDSGLIEILPLAASEAKSIAAIMKRYESMAPQLADAALVYLAGREQIDTIFTLDRRDFSIYRGSIRRAFKLLP
jgi:hypothetical protein